MLLVIAAVYLFVIYRLGGRAVVVAGVSVDFGSSRCCVFRNGLYCMAHEPDGLVLANWRNGVPDTSAHGKMQFYFRMCLIANMSSVLLMFGSAVVVGYIARAMAPETIATADDSWLTWSYLVATRVSLFIGLPAFLIAVVGMMRFRLWARQLFSWLVLAWAAETVGFLIFNLDLVWGLAGIFAYFACLTSGAVLAMSYFTPLANLFVRSPVHSAASGAVGASIG